MSRQSNNLLLNSTATTQFRTLSISASRLKSKSDVEPPVAEGEAKEGASVGEEENGGPEGGEAKDTGTIKMKSYIVHDVETSLRYMKSNAYKTTYGEEPVWAQYKRNYKGHFAPKKTRESCIRSGKYFTSNPCPLCRDEYLVVHHKNIELLEQFISPYTGLILESTKTGVCRKKQFDLKLEILKAKDMGLIKFEVPFRKYDYADYYPQLADLSSK